MREKQRELTHGRLLARNVIWNLLGIGTPFLVALVTIPILIHEMGTMRFGILTIIWVLVGYFSLFDFGIGRALTKLVAELLGSSKSTEVASVVWAAMALILVLGVIGTIILTLATPWVVTAGLNIPEGLQNEAQQAFYFLALSIPLVLATTGLRGFLEAHQRFKLVAAVRIPFGSFTFVGPALVMPFTNSLVAVTVVLAAGRLVALLAYLSMCVHIGPEIRRPGRIRRDLLKALFHFGGWMTVSNIARPFMSYMDQIVIGGIATMTAVTFYAVPREIVSKFSILPASLMGVMFPAFATALEYDRKRVAQIFSRAVNYVMLALFPAMLIIIVFASEGLTLWLGNDFAEQSGLVLQLLAVGMLFNGISHVPFGLVQGVGRPDLTAVIDLVQLPFYMLAMWWLVTSHGVLGAAIAWVGRMLVDTVIIFFAASRLVPETLQFTIRTLFFSSIALVILLASMLISGLITKTVFLLIVLPAFAIAAWLYVLTPEDRTLLYRYASKYVTVPSNQ